MSRRTTSGSFDFVDNNNLSGLDNKIGRHAPPMGTRKDPTNSIYGKYALLFIILAVVVLGFIFFIW